MDAEFLAGINALIDRVEALEKKLRAVDPDALKEANAVADRLVRERAQAKSERELYGSEAAILADKQNQLRDTIKAEQEAAIATLRNTAAVGKSQMAMLADITAEVRAMRDETNVKFDEFGQMASTLNARHQTYLESVDQAQSELSSFAAKDYIDAQLSKAERQQLNEQHRQEIERQMRLLMAGGNPEQPDA